MRTSELLLIPTMGPPKAKVKKRKVKVKSPKPATSLKEIYFCVKHHHEFTTVTHTCASTGFITDRLNH